jgi:hypothetical protein
MVGKQTTTFQNSGQFKVEHVVPHLDDKSLDRTLIPSAADPRQQSGRLIVAFACYAIGSFSWTMQSVALGGRFAPTLF